MTDKKNYDAEFCGNLPLHNVNLIQDYGYLLVLEAGALNIIQASENISDLTGKPVAECIDTHISAYISAADLEKLKSNLEQGLKQRIPFDLEMNGNGQAQQLHALMHIKDDYVLIELEKVNEASDRVFSHVFQEVKKAMAAIDQAETVQAVCEQAIHELRKISGFDGILMYKFDENWNGTVIAEEKDDRLEPYLGQTFPASDVPKQARQLYLKNPYRLIPNREYEPVRLYPVINPVTNSFIDLSDCNLRSVAAVHLEYMKNMGVTASMSIRVIKDDKLWGLISCHHLGEKYLDYEVCSIFEWLSAVISTSISRLLDKEAYELSTSLQQKRAVLTDRVYEENDIAPALFTTEGTNILDLFSATGAAVVLNGRMETIGEVPAKDDMENLMFWLEGKSISKVFTTANLAGLYGDAAAYAGIGSGLLVIPIDSMRGDYLVCFRPEVPETIHWGGNPNEAINFDKDGIKYHPRNSFKLWKETVSQHALPWTAAELELADTLRSFLFEFRTKQLYS